jgi:uncharacterized protein (TIGR03437 family)
LDARYQGEIYPSGLAVDASGIYVSGFKNFAHALPGQCASSAGGDSIVFKFDLDGADLWTREFGTPDTAWSTGVALDGDGVYVAGATFEEPSALGQEEIAVGAFLTKLDKTEAASGSAPRIFQECVVNAANYIGGGVVAGEIVTIFGSTMGPSGLVAASIEAGKLPNTLAGTRILFKNVPGALLYVSGTQSSAIVPYAVGGESTLQVQVEYKGVQSEPVTIPVVTSRPGVFSLDGSGQGQGAILNADGTVNSTANPASKGSVINIFATGGGEAAAGVTDGQILGGILPMTTLPVSVFFDYGRDDFGVPAKHGEVLYAGGVPGAVAGMLQVKVRVPSNAQIVGDAVTLALIIGAHDTVFQIALR